MKPTAPIVKPVVKLGRQLSNTSSQEPAHKRPRTDSELLPAASSEAVHEAAASSRSMHSAAAVEHTSAAGDSSNQKGSSTKPAASAGHGMHTNDTQHDDDNEEDHTASGLAGLLGGYGSESEAVSGNADDDAHDQVAGPCSRGGATANAQNHPQQPTGTWTASHLQLPSADELLRAEPLRPTAVDSQQQQAAAPHQQDDARSSPNQSEGSSE